MFQDLVQRAKLHGESVESEREKKKAAKMIMIDFVKSVLPDIEALGFNKVTFYNHGNDYFHLHIQAGGYEHYNYTHNIEFSSTSSNINYGYGATSAKGNQIQFDYNWSDSKLIATMKSALRATIMEALKAKETRRTEL